MNVKSFQTRRAALLATSASLVLAGLTGVSSQDSSADEEEVEEVVVTGSRIVRQDLAAPSPLQVVGVEDIQFGAETNIGDLINQLPAAGAPAFNRTNSNFSVANGGVTSVDLRNLGSNRTLILQNGRRFVAGVPGSSAVDLNMIPTPLVERVEVITGGASSVYGSDAVAGVVNFITKKDFEGLELNVRQEWAEVNGGDELNVSAVAGGNFADGRGNATVFLGYSEQEAVFSRDVERTAVDQVSAVFSGGQPFEAVRPAFSSFAPQGRFNAGTVGFENEFTYLPDGTLVQGFDTNGVNGIANGFNRSEFRTIAIPTERLNANAFVNYAISDSINYYLELSYARTETNTEIEPTPLNSTDIFPGTFGIPTSYLGSDGNPTVNPFIPQEILAVAATTGTDRISFTRRLSEFGNRGSFDTRQTFRAATGLEGEFEDLGLRWELGYVYGSTTQAQISQGAIDTQSFRNALLAEQLPDGTIQCVDANARAQGCVPINIFGFNTISQGALDYITSDATRNASVEQNIVHGFVSGDLFELPGGPLSFAVGFEYREEESSIINDSLTRRGLSSGNATPSVVGDFDVLEGFVELNAPLISDGIVDYLGLTGSLRISDYSSVGQTESYQFGVEFAPIEDIRFRASYARATRAPNIGELFNPGAETFATVADPCDGVTNDTAGTVAANCRSIPEIQARIDATGAFTLSLAERQGTGGFVGGNASLTNPNAAPLFEESADTYTVGAVFQPTFLPSGINYSATVDYFNITVDDAISSIGRQAVLNQCFNDPTFTANPLCSNIVRFGAGSPTPGALDSVDSGVANVAQFKTSGIDVTSNLTVDADVLGLGDGQFTLRGSYTYLINLESQTVADVLPDNADGEIGAPKHRFNLNFGYRTDNWSIQWQTRFISSVVLDDQFLTAQDCIDFEFDCRVNAEIYNDLQVRYTLPESLTGATRVEVFGGIENVFDNDPPLIPASLPGSDTGTETFAGSYDAIGRTLYLGARVKF